MCPRNPCPRNPPAKTQTKPDAKPLPDSEVRSLREAPDERQDRSPREFEADPVIGFVIRTIVRNVAGTVRRNVKNNVEIAVLETVADYVNGNVPRFHDKAVVRTIAPESATTSPSLKAGLTPSSPTASRLRLPSGLSLATPRLDYDL
jgi:hypothetical protein